MFNGIQEEHKLHLFGGAHVEVIKILHSRYQEQNKSLNAVSSNQSQSHLREDVVQLLHVGELLVEPVGLAGPHLDVVPKDDGGLLKLLRSHLLPHTPGHAR